MISLWGSKYQSTVIKCHFCQFCVYWEISDVQCPVSWTCVLGEPCGTCSKAVREMCVADPCRVVIKGVKDHLLPTDGKFSYLYLRFFLDGNFLPLEFRGQLENVVQVTILWINSQITGISPLLLKEKSLRVFNSFLYLFPFQGKWQKYVNLCFCHCCFSTTFWKAGKLDPGLISKVQTQTYISWEALHWSTPTMCCLLFEMNPGCFLEPFWEFLKKF